MLILLQAVLGFDNLLYISLESKKVEPEKRNRVRVIGISLAIVLRIGLLFLLMKLITLFQDELFAINLGKNITSSFNGHSLIVLFGGGFIIYTAMKEIWHMISHETLDEDKADKDKKKSTSSVIAMIVVMNLVFSFDSILSAMALTSTIHNDTTELILMSIAIIGSGLLMILLANKVARFLEKNRMFEVLGLFVLFIVGIMLLTEGGHLANIVVYGHHIVPMNKTTFYFVIIVLVLVDIVQSRYQKKIIRIEQAEEKRDKMDKNESKFVD
ncbi:tellurium resistance protein TerC [Paracrocinitomix mangrovi]|uniref:TerC family protein n=1 Tax=Paracrocinitomix mangrovi TaxID=2862509 RepID=UPI001ED9E060|nr:tellurium resistance protein TerC [Paracrocinitomix mangrovi]UKN01893.1 tellurium resistance protein TerC [Paracrocinitomix mangrovi]